LISYIGITDRFRGE